MGFGLALKKHGAEFSPRTNLWHCLGACNVGGSTIDWVMKTKGVSLRHAVEPSSCRSFFYHETLKESPEALRSVSIVASHRDDSCTAGAAASDACPPP